VNEFSDGNRVVYLVMRNTAGIEDIKERLARVGEADDRIVVHFREDDASGTRYVPVNEVLEKISERAVDYRLVVENKRGDRSMCAVSRFYGGLGDIVSMYPSILTIATRYEKVYLFIPQIYHFFFRNIPNVECHDHTHTFRRGTNIGLLKIRYPHLYNRCGVIYDLFCPAIRYEMQTNYKPKKSRLEVFADAFKVEPEPPRISLPPPTFDLPSPVVGFNLFSMNRSKDWPIIRVRSVCQELVKQGINVVTMDMDVGIAEARSYVDMTVEELCSMISALDCMVSTDTGPFHVAGACGIPVVGLFGPTDGALTAKHYENVKVIHDQRDDACFRPCYFATTNRYRCANNIGDCMKDIKAEQVIDAVMAIVS